MSVFIILLIIIIITGVRETLKFELQNYTSKIYIMIILDYNCQDLQLLLKMYVFYECSSIVV